MKKFVIYSLFASVLLLSACSTKLDVIGNYKETMVVYGLLDQSQPKQYIKINKAFLGEGNALQFAQIKDSTQYTHALNVTLGYKNKVGADTTVTLQPDNMITKGSGTFYGPDQTNVIYSFPTPSGAGTMPTSSTYKLVIKNTETGKEVSSQTSLISDFTFNKPSPNPLSLFAFVIPYNPNFHFFVEWNTPKNARACQLTIRLNYMDYLDNNSDGIIDDTISQKIDWVFPTQQTVTLAGGEIMGIDFRGLDFLQFIGNQLNDYPHLIERRAGLVDLIVVGAADDLNTYIQVNAPSTGIIQERPEFTNITNGLGIFSSRYNKLPFSKSMTGATLDTLACGQYTKGLKFLNGAGILPFCP